jgi:hypothetical protein
MKIVRCLTSVVLLAFTFACSSKESQKPLAVSTPSAAAENYPSLATQAQEVNDAVLRKDYNRFIDLIYPKVVELAGGRERMLAAINKELKDMEGEGVTIIEATSGTPTQFLNDSGNIYAVVPTKLKMKAKDGIFLQEGAMIGVSSDGGARWSFVDASGKDQSELKTILPNVADKLNLPGEKLPQKIS